MLSKKYLFLLLLIINCHLEGRNKTICDKPDNQEIEDCCIIKPIIKKSTTITLKHDTTWAFDEKYQFEGSCKIKGNGHTLTLNGGGIIVGKKSKLFLHNVNIIGAESITCSDDTSSLILEDVQWHFTKIPPPFSEGYFIVYKGNFHITGKGPFIYRSNKQSIIRPNASLVFDDIMFLYAPSSKIADLIVLRDRSSLLYLKNTQLMCANKMQLTCGTLINDGNSTLLGVYDNSSFTIGDGKNKKNDLFIDFLSGSTLTLYINFHYNNTE